MTKFAKLALLALACMANASTDALMTNPVQTTKSSTNFNKIGPRTFITRDIKTPDPVPEEGRQAAMELMSTGRLYRYNVKSAEESVVSQCEQAVIDYTGHKYCVALNSCGSAIFLMMKCTGLKPGGKVLSNAFTFGAVPSAIEHAGGKAVYVESNDAYVMDIKDLEKKLIANPDAKHVLVSHMRGKLGDMNAITELCERHDVHLLEDCAHSLGVYWEGKHSGHKGIVSAISSQSYKMINSGEGGFLLTNDPLIAAKTAVYAGAYEGLSAKHTTVPGPEVFGTLPTDIPNYSLRMSALAASVIKPQIKTLDERTEKYNARYATLVSKVTARMGDHVSVSPITPGCTRPVHDSLQFNLSPNFTEEQVQHFLDECASHGLPVECFGHKTNARNFINWNFAPADEPLPQTAKMLKKACDVRMPLMWDDEDFDDMASVICESLEAVLAKA
jgi:dTDP-4-amino-4,6-dideoxygalactose transaminase